MVTIGVLSRLLPSGSIKNVIDFKGNVKDENKMPKCIYSEITREK